MIFHSIIPPEIVFAEFNSYTGNNSLEMEYLGERVEVSKLENNKFRINRLISTSPRAYLDPRLQPGMIIGG